ncbi:hypothetical protein [Actibacterium lipolyticum]|uniref:DUF2238 domain-containing protein n=1 Tax=Actibacterium lipolyticum TaxID=1524263 RepID=A0A238JS74_9RHOB|nr:hypothetical protein [Actibacterium lipolyticum]SMX33500.1 hypothetical protein COL8621_01036 [Actibacterium lipolyticum]
MKLRHHSKIIYAVWAILLVACAMALWNGRWSVAFVSIATLGLSLLPEVVVRRFNVRLPVSFYIAITLFLFATLFLGEVFDFYERYWWWDVLLHGGSAMGFGLLGLIFVLLLFEGDRYAAPPLALAIIAFSVAMTIGALWEVFEFAMDQSFGMNMQKSGLVDTMWDLIVDAIGATAGATAGFLYLKGRERRGASRLIGEFVNLNRRLFRKFR